MADSRIINIGGESFELSDNDRIPRKLATFFIPYQMARKAEKLWDILQLHIVTQSLTNKDSHLLCDKIRFFLLNLECWFPNFSINDFNLQNG